MSRVMKDSGVEWIGKIPATWYPTRNKFLLTGSYSGGTPKATEDKFYSGSKRNWVQLNQYGRT